MKKAALVAVFLATGCASSDWAKVESVPGGKLYVPKLYAPLLPDSIYPDRKTPVPAKGRPVLVLVCPEKGDCGKDEVLDRAAQRGLVVFIGRETDPNFLRSRAEADPARMGTREVGTGTLKASTNSPSKKIFLATFPSAAPSPVDDETVLKLYSPNKKNLVPAEAFRDAVEWLAGELGAR